MCTPRFYNKGMFEYRIFAPVRTATSKATYFYGRESDFEKAWDAVAVYVLNDSRWKDDPVIQKGIAAVDDHIGGKGFEVWLPFGTELFTSSQDASVRFEIDKVR